MLACTFVSDFTERYFDNEGYISMNKKDCITTIGGRVFAPLDPSPDDIDIIDIAHSLSLICRANGHFKSFFSVARHCINCAKEAEARGYSTEVRLLCLLHDASEAYIGDMTRPIKRRLDYYCECEEKISAMIYEKLCGFVPDDEQLTQVKAVDDCMLYHEFLTFNGDRLFEAPPEIHIDIAKSERDHLTTRAEFLELYEKYKTLLGEEYKKC